MTHAAAPSTLQAPAYGLLLAHTECHFCHAPTPTAAIWVPSFEEHDDEDLVDQGGGRAALHRAFGQEHCRFRGGPRALASFHRHPDVRANLPGHHCTCGALQGDHFVFSPDGPYWPQNDVELARLTFVQGLGPLTAQASAGQSAWMDRVPLACAQA